MKETDFTKNSFGSRNYLELQLFAFFLSTKIFTTFMPLIYNFNYGGKSKTFVCLSIIHHSKLSWNISYTTSLFIDVF